MEGLFTIGEFARRSGLSPKRLRTYAAAGLMVPAAVDTSSGYRYYSPDQVPEGRLIDALRAAGVPLADITTLLSGPADARLDEWSRRVQRDAIQRQEALDLARLLLGRHEDDPTTRQQNTGMEPMTRLRAASRCETGLVRTNNEDAVVSNERLALVADGLGGCPGGETASALASSILEAAYTGRSVDELLAGVRSANRAIWAAASGNAALEGMGTTICAVGLDQGGDLAVVNVGDSRAYLLHDGSLRQLTEDHSFTADLVRQGELTQREVADHPLRGVITRALGVGPGVEVDSDTHSVAVGDRLLLCSDGLVNDVPANEITALMNRRAGLEATVDRLIDTALAHGGHDNISVIVAEVVT